MKSAKLFSFALAAVLAACGAPAPEAEAAPEPAARPGPTAAVQTVAQGNAGFGVALYKRLAEKPGNLFLSPISIAGAFGPVVAGAEGETEAAIARALHFPTGGPALHPALGGLLVDLERAREGVTLSIANALWVQQGFALMPAFLQTARGPYSAEVDSLDFRNAEAAAARINRWVSDETRQRIPTLIAPAMLNERTRLVVTNAVYFLGDWGEAFDTDATVEQPFHLPGGGTRPVPLMQRTGRYRYFETGDFQAIDLPYKDERLSMSVLLPKKRNGLGAFEASLTEQRLAEWLRRLDAAEPRKVALLLPKLKIEEEYSLVPPLEAMGMGIAFTRRANFRGIAEADLRISDVVHKTFLRMDEKGTEAAAATGVVIELTSAGPEPPTFRADHPFFLVIREKSSGAILFLGRVASPEPA